MSNKFVYTVTHTVNPYSHVLCGGCPYIYESEYLEDTYECSLFEEDLLFINKDHIERCGACMDAEDKYKKENGNG